MNVCENTEKVGFAPFALLQAYVKVRLRRKEQNLMIKPKFPRALVAVGLAVACVFALTACFGTKEPAADKTVAATVNGTEIYESEITSAIESIRANYNLTDNDTWGKYLAQIGLTPADVRSQVLDSFIQRELVLQGAEARGLAVEDSEIDQVVETTRSHFETDKDWQNALQSAGMTEEQYREEIRTSLLNNKLIDSFMEEAVVPTEELDMYAGMYGPSLAGAKRSSHILFATTDEATAQEVLDRINSGELDFAEAASLYSIDEGSASDGGDVGWDKLSNFITEYTTALSQLKKGEVSGLVTSVYGIHIIKCTDVFDADPTGTITFTMLPKDFQDAIEGMLKNTAGQTAYQTWLEEQRESSDIVINDIPSNVSYNVDMSKYQTASASSAAASSADASSSSASASGEASSSASASGEASGETSSSAFGEASSSASASSSPSAS